MRLIREFYEALELLLNKDLHKRQEEIKKMYDQYVGPYAFYHTATVDEVMESIEHFDEKERLPRMAMLAELYYADSTFYTGPLKHMLLQKALVLFDFIDRHERTFDMQRLGKMNDIRKQLDNQ